ncbi:MAG: aconitate hydratase [Planctomycetes bacterium]|jgi:aconitate hydratase|nr:aconitate hydratase [Phycisphaerae bacterium]NBB95810.1 aconitate hydratase [Planctomycetota bacterium]
MGQTVVQKILSQHIVDGESQPGSEVGIRIDQTLTQDATGTTAFLLLEAMDIPQVKTDLSVSYVDHNMAQFGPENHNDHLYLQSIAPKLGAYHSRPGNGICHQVHLERFGVPGKTLLGSDSHTPTGGGIGMVAIGAGGLDVAVAMGGGAFYTTYPRIIGVELRGSLQPWVAAKDIILRLLSILSTKGNVGCMVEYFGEGVASLPVPARATCTNMGAELGVTTSVFPSDATTRQFLDAQGRAEAWTELQADADAQYPRITKALHAERDVMYLENIKQFCTNVEVAPPDDDGRVDVSFGHVVIDLDQLEPLLTGPGSPDAVTSVGELVGMQVGQVAIGSCTNSSYQDLMLVANALGGRTVHPNVELGLAPGSRQVMNMIARNGALADIVQSGARILESGCGPCIGLGFSPAEGTVSLRTFNRNFVGRSGTTNDMVYLVSPEVAVMAALAGEVVDPRTYAEAEGIAYPDIAEPDAFLIDDSLIQSPLYGDDAKAATVVRGSTIVKPPAGEALGATVSGNVVIKVGDKITTDHIMPAGAFLKYRSNVPEYATVVFDAFNEEHEPTFADRCLALKEQGKAAIIVAGDSYGQGSSREHAALCPMYLGVRVVIAKAIERIHQANLVNFAILPLVFAHDGDYDRIQPGDALVVEGVDEAIASGETVTVRNGTQGVEFECKVQLAPRQRTILAAGGLLQYTKQQG